MTARGQEPAPIPRPAPLPSFVTDGPVNAFATAGGRLFVGGAFSRIGPQTGGLAAVQQADGARVVRLPQVAGAVYAIAPDGAGGHYIGGAFGAVGGLPRANLAHVLADGTVDPGFNPSPDSFVFGLAVVGDRLFVGGDFVRMGTEIRRRLAALRIPTGELDQRFNPGVDGAVGDILPVGDKLLVDGAFRGIAGVSRRGFAAIDQVEGNLVPGFDVTPDGRVDVLHRMGDTIYLGGQFTMINGRSRSGLAAVTADTGELVEEFAPAVNGRVTAMADDGDRLFVGGGFTEIAQTFDNGLASLDPRTGRASAEFRFFAQGGVASIALVGGEVFVGGNFTKINETPIARLAVADKVTGVVRPTFAPDPNGDISIVQANGGELLVGGAFSSVPRTPAGNLAALDAASGDHDPSFTVTVGGAVTALDVDGSRLVIGGAFDAVNTLPRTNLAAVDAGTGALDALAVPVEGRVADVDAQDGEVYVGGSFNVQRHWGLLRIRGNRLDQQFNLRLTKPRMRKRRPPLLDRFSTVNELVRSGDRLWVGGGFSTPAAPRNALLQLRDGKLVKGFKPRMRGEVGTLALVGGNLVVGGSFVQRFVRFKRVEDRNGKRRKVPVFREGLFALAAGDGALRRGFSPRSSGDLLALASSGSNVFVGGGFAELNRLRVDNLGALDPAGRLVAGYTPEPLQGTLYGQPTFSGSAVQALQVAGGRLYVGGDFSQVGFLPQAYLAALPLEPAA